MEILKRAVRGSPYIGVFSVVTEDFGIFPLQATGKELNGLGETLGIEVVQMPLANSPLIGVFAAALGKRIAVPGIVEPQEIERLEGAGFRVRQIEELTALGNLLLINSKGGIASRMIGEENVKELSRFFGVKLVQESLAGTELPGACAVVTELGFIANPNVTEKEFGGMERAFGVKGATTTANYGDVFVGNDVLANSKAAVVGAQTSGHELIRIDSGLRG